MIHRLNTGAATGFAFVLAFAVTCACAAPTKTITVSADDQAYKDYPVAAAVTAPEGAKSAVLTDAGSGRTIAAQLWRDGSQAMLSWILPELPAGRSVSYDVKFSNTAAAGPGGVAIRQGQDAAEVSIGGTLFTRYIISGAPKPYCYPVIGPTGAAVTRNYPMKEVEGEAKDHSHHRSLWFTHGGVNGTDYWAEGKRGKEIHRAFEALESGPVMGRILARTDWVKPDGRKDCEDVRDIRFYNVAGGRMLDWTLTIHATEGPVKFTDTKEGTFGFRIATSMRLRRPDRKKGDGHIVNSEGQVDGETWGKSAKWCDYSGPVEGKTVGIAIMDHPQSFRHPTYWHVRDYGLFAANPFGLHNFKNLKNQMPGEYTVPKGGSVTFRYRCWIHEGDAEQAKVADVYEQFANPPKVDVK